MHTQDDKPHGYFLRQKGLIKRTIDQPAKKLELLIDYIKNEGLLDYISNREIKDGVVMINQIYVEITKLCEALEISHQTYKNWQKKFKLLSSKHISGRNDLYRAVDSIINNPHDKFTYYNTTWGYSFDKEYCNLADVLFFLTLNSNTQKFNKSMRR